MQVCTCEFMKTDGNHGNVMVAGFRGTYMGTFLHKLNIVNYFMFDQ